MLTLPMPSSYVLSRQVKDLFDETGGESIEAGRHVPAWNKAPSVYLVGLYNRT